MGSARSVSVRTTVLTRTDVLTVAAFDHGGGRHRDPSEERFELPTVVLTERGSWGMASPAGATDVDDRVVVLGAGGRAFRCRHDAAVPADRTLYVEYRGPWELLAADGPLFRRPAVARTPAIARIHAALRREAAVPGPAHRMKVDALGMDLLVESLRAASPPAAPRRARPVHPDIRDRVLAVRGHIDAHFDRELSLADLAAVAGLSPWYLGRRFREVVGTSPHRYLVGVRLARAEELLRDGDLTVTQVCHRVGFGSLGHFTEAFRERTGLPPGRWRDVVGDRTRNRNH